MGSIREVPSNLFSNVASCMFVLTTLNQFLPHPFRESIWERLGHYFRPYTKITIHEYNGCGNRSEAYDAIEIYLTAKSNSLVKHLTAEYVKKNNSITIANGDREVVYDEFKGVKAQWCLARKTESISGNPVPDERYFVVKFHRKHGKIVKELYLNYIWQEYKAFIASNRQNKLYTKCLFGKDGLFVIQLFLED